GVIVGGGFRLQWSPPVIGGSAMTFNAASAAATSLQWSPPVIGGSAPWRNTSRANAGWRLQWSPSVIGGSARGVVAGPGRRLVAAMEPAGYRRERGSGWRTPTLPRWC